MKWIFKALFKKEVSKLKEQEIQYYSKIRSLKKDNEDVIMELKKEKKKNQRIEYLLNDKSKLFNEIAIEKTSKNITVVVFLKYEPLEIWIYDLDNEEINARHSLLVYTSTRQDSLYINDIQGGRSFGHGNLAMKYIIKYAQHYNFASITGNLSKTDIGHKERLFAFYKKHGFTIELNEYQNYFGTIHKNIK